ncbi:hypothetical protein [Sinisalibacter aestuarii]|uniref:ATP/GTP-binding protein n=1 Tax=Sinisalibacter aestuarii TaxID=2949426 RepID=A0ABQ5LQZ6_9RHOB|nr:hypothetical protein [Sinisalibacter aestuarii]GKY87033.1 ATP/GTP-binding protein [Sinisalibacter aestuarii]
MRYITICATLCLASAASAETLTELWTLDGFQMPESAYYEAGSGNIVVSNIGAFGPDGGMDGALSLVSPDGSLIEASWVDGLMDPKGMASHDGKLYVADAVGLQVVDIASGTLEATIALPGAMFPNDVAVGPDGAVYVSEFMGGGIFRVMDGTAELWKELGSLPLPNGIFVDGDRMIVGSFGDEMGENFAVNNPGGLIAVDLATGEATPLDGAQGVASVDGLVAVGDMIVYDDNPTGRIMLWKDGTNQVIAETAPGAADLGAMDTTILVPNLNAGQVTAYQLSE